MTRHGNVIWLRPRRVRDTRNDANSYRCKKCNGAGCFEDQVGLCDFDVTTCRECYGMGWITWRDPDPLENLKLMRKWARYAPLRPEYDKARARALGVN